MHTGSKQRRPVLVRHAHRLRTGVVLSALVWGNLACDLESSWTRLRNAVAQQILEQTSEDGASQSAKENGQADPRRDALTTPERREQEARRHASCRFDLWQLYVLMMQRYHAAAMQGTEAVRSNAARCATLGVDPQARPPGFEALVEARTELVSAFHQLESLLDREQLDRSRVEQAAQRFSRADEAFQRQLDSLHATNDPQFLRLLASRDSSVSYHGQAILVAARSVVRCRERNLRALAAKEGNQDPGASSRGWSENCRAMGHTFEATWAEFQAALSRQNDRKQQPFWLSPLTQIADGFRVELRETMEESRRLRPKAANEIPSQVELNGLRIYLARLRSAAGWVDGASNTGTGLGRR